MVACQSYVSGMLLSDKKKKNVQYPSDTNLKLYIHTDSYCNDQIHPQTHANLHSIYLKMFGGGGSSFRWRYNKVIQLKSIDNIGGRRKVAIILAFDWEKLVIINLARSL